MSKRKKTMKTYEEKAVCSEQISDAVFDISRDTNVNFQNFSQGVIGVASISSDQKPKTFSENFDKDMPYEIQDPLEIYDAYQHEINRH